MDSTVELEGEQQGQSVGEKGQSARGFHGGRVYGQVFAHHPSVMLLIDPSDGHIVDANRAAERFYGWPRRLLLSMAIHDINVLQRDQVMAEMSAAQHEQRNYFEFRHRLATGEVRDVDVYSGPVEVGERTLLASVVTDATERHRMAATMQASEEFSRNIVAHAPMAIAVADLTGRLLRVNAAMTRITGYPEHELVGRDFRDLTHPDDLPASHEQVRRLLAGEVSGHEIEKRYVRRDGSTVRVKVASSLLCDERGVPQFHLGMVEELSSLTEARGRASDLAQQLDVAARRFAALVEHGSDLTMVVHDTEGISYASPTVHAFLSPAEIAPIDVDRLLAAVDSSHVDGVIEAWRRVRGKAGAVEQVEVRARRRDGQWRILRVSFTNQHHVEALAGVVVNGHDVTDERNVRARFDQHMVRDGLTGLANRTALIDALSTHCADSAVAPFCLVLLDLVGMAGVNDRVGHVAGDLLLRSVAARLMAAAAADGLVARTSGDEFAVVVPGMEDPDSALIEATRLATVFDAPFEVPGGGAVRLKVHVGVASSAGSDGTPIGLLQDADLALSDARSTDGPTARFCDSALRQRHRRRLAIEHGLDDPDLCSALSLQYQPVVELAHQTITGVEALVRWNHPELGPVGPNEFIPVAERTGAITVISDWVLDTACRQLAQWDAAGLPQLCMSVNVSARQLLDPHLPGLVERILTDTGVPAPRLCIEVTETALADESEVTLQVVRGLVALGTQIHIDDFGTGWSSFEQLRRFTFHGLKIDRSFVERLGIEPTTDVIVAGILSIARTLGLHVIAEGVERNDQRNILTSMGCDAGQGYLWSRPVNPDQIPPLLHQYPSQPHLRSSN